MVPTKYFLDWQRILCTRALHYSNQLTIHLEEKFRSKDEILKEDFPSLKNIARCIKNDEYLKEYFSTWTVPRIANYISSMYRGGAFQDRSLGSKGLVPVSYSQSHVPMPLAIHPSPGRISEMDAKFRDMQDKVTILTATMRVA